MIALKKRESGTYDKKLHQRNIAWWILTEKFDMNQTELAQITTKMGAYTIQQTIQGALQGVKLMTNEEPDLDNFDETKTEQNGANPPENEENGENGEKVENEKKSKNSAENEENGENSSKKGEKLENDEVGQIDKKEPDLDNFDETKTTQDVDNPLEKGEKVENNEEQ